MSVDELRRLHTFGEDVSLKQIIKKFVVDFSSFVVLLID